MYNTPESFCIGCTQGSHCMFCTQVFCVHTKHEAMFVCYTQRSHCMSCTQGSRFSALHEGHLRVLNISVVRPIHKSLVVCIVFKDHIVCPVHEDHTVCAVR